jgi:hypothetical protein
MQKVSRRYGEGEICSGAMAAFKLNIRVRIAIKSEAGKVAQTVDYTNIKIDPQPDSLFETPAGYTKE